MESPPSFGIERVSLSDETENVELKRRALQHAHQQLEQGKPQHALEVRGRGQTAALAHTQEGCDNSISLLLICNPDILLPADRAVASHPASAPRRGLRRRRQVRCHRCLEAPLQFLYTLSQLM